MIEVPARSNGTEENIQKKTQKANDFLEKNHEFFFYYTQIYYYNTYSKNVIYSD